MNLMGYDLFFKVKYFTFQILVLLQFTSFSQPGYNSNWILGYSTSPDVSGTNLYFDNDSVKVISLVKKMFMEGSTTAMSDSLGNLLFYSNGCYIANKDHNLMLNGDSIGLGKLETSYCKTGGNPLIQSIISIPHPDESNLFYVFYTDLEIPYEYPIGLYFPLAPTHLYYAIIDMDLDNGLGEVIVKNQLILSDTLARSSIKATRHINGLNWWVIIPESHSNCYYKILVDSEGIDSVYYQCIGTVWDDNDATGQAVFSPTGKKYVRNNSSNGLNIYDFDNQTGLLYNPIRIFISDIYEFSGVAFSSNSTYLYVTTGQRVYQFDITASTIEDSKTLIAELNTPPHISYITTFHLAQLGPDERIYIGGTNTHRHLHVINNPNCKGTSSDLQQYSIEMPAFNLYGLPNMPNYGDYNNDIACDSAVDLDVLNNERYINIFPNPFSDYIYIEESKDICFVLFNSEGQIIFKKDIKDFPYYIDLSFLPSGIYFYQSLFNRDLSSYGKLIKY